MPNCIIINLNLQVLYNKPATHTEKEKMMTRNKSKIVVLDTYALGQQKIQNEENVIFKALLEVFPNHRIATPTHPFRGYYTTWVDNNGQPLRDTYKGDVRHTSFGILEPKLEDKRGRLFNIAIGELPPSALIGSIEIKYKMDAKKIESFTIEVFGQNNKRKIIDFAKKLQESKLLSGVKIEVKVETKEPRLEKRDYQTS